MKLDRRDFLRTAAAGAAACTVAPIVLMASLRRDDADSTTPPALLDTIGRDAVRRIGVSYRARVPDESDAQVLRARLAPRPTRGAIADDFAAGRTVVVDGWVLSVTEARECALYSLLA